jgi:putative ABC transport system permease protein
VTSVAELLSRSLGDRRLASWLVGALAAVTLVIAAAGLYGAMAFSVWRRTREIGVRLALGARRGEVMRLVLGEAGRIVLIGGVAGIGGALLAVRLVRSLLFDTATYDPMTYAVVTAGLIGVAFVASYLPARRASRIDPMHALRVD